MTITSNSILKLLSDLSITSDKIIEEDSHTQAEANQVLKWFETIKVHALAITNYKPASTTVDEECCIPFSGKEIPSLDSFLKGPSERGRRLLSDVSQMAKDNLRKRKRSQKIDKSLSKSDTSVSPTDLSNKKTNERETIVYTEDNKKVVEKETPLRKKENHLKELKQSSKRKSSSELATEPTKRLCVTNKTEANGPSKKSPRIIKLEKLAELKKASIVAPPNRNTSILKENTVVRSKETKVNENLKTTQEKERAVRKLKTDENKRKHEEKMGQEKIKALRNRNCANSTKNEIKAVPENTNKKPNGRENEVVKRSVLASKNTSLKKLPTSLVSKKVTELKNQERKEKGSTRTPPPCVKKNDIVSAQTILPTGSVRNERDAMNGTFLVKENSSSGVGNKGGKCPKLLKEANSGKIVKTLGSHTEKSQCDKSKQQTSSANTPVPKRTESYAITPLRSSFVSYDISEIKSDDSEDEAGEESSSKPIPSWATGIHLRNALLQQHHHPLNSDELFGNYFPNLDLNMMMGVTKKFNKRTSSAIWNSSFA
ncbi:INCENP_ARK-bind domain-containing protein [Nephila pilipes]|uniref:INCENP_ARK-bind domain-containing protein n=1 Tax=Nephila pilipes TaxID=299642 RepID=A0A8X6NH51_NEPPI|nr:INCENP_ARK-bind domain-containing protein [Nephila pilipes]